MMNWSFRNFLFTILLFAGLFTFNTSSAQKDYFSHFANNADIPNLNINLKLSKQDKIGFVQKNYLEGEYATVVKSGNNGSLSIKDDYMYYQSLSHLKEWGRLLREVPSSKYFNDSLLKASYYQMHLEAALRSENLTQARLLYQRYKDVLKGFVPYSHIVNIVDELAALSEQKQIAITQGGYYYYLYKKTKNERYLEQSLKLYHPNALSTLSASNYKKYFNSSDPKLLAYAKKSYQGLYVALLKANKQYSILGAYYFKKGKYTAAATHSPKGSFYYHMARLMSNSKKADQSMDVAYAKKNLPQSAFYLSTYYYNKENFKGVLDVFNQHFASGTLRYLIVLGLDKKYYQSVYNALNNHYTKKTTVPKKERSSFYYWLAYTSKQVHKVTQSNALFMKSASDYPYSYYGWESYKLLQKNEANIVMKQWKTYASYYKKRYDNLLNQFKSEKLPKNNPLIKKAMFFFTVREDKRALHYLRSFLNNVPNKQGYYDDLIKEFYRMSRMDYYVAYNRFIYQEVDRLSDNKNLFFKDLMELSLPLLYKDYIKKASKEFDIEESSLQSLILQESNYDYRAISWVGAQGLAQLMPATAKPILKSLYKKGTIRNQDVFDPHTNIMLGGYYFAWLYNKFYKKYPPNDRLILSYASYNAGPGRIKKMYEKLSNIENFSHFIESIAFQESRNYSKILLLKRDLYKYFRGVS